MAGLGTNTSSDSKFDAISKHMVKKFETGSEEGMMHSHGYICLHGVYFGFIISKGLVHVDL